MNFKEKLTVSRAKVHKLKHALESVSIQREDGPCWCAVPGGHTQACLQAREVLDSINKNASVKVGGRRD